MTNAAELSAGFNYWGRFTFDSTTEYLAADVTFNHLLKIPLAFDLGVSPLGAVQRDDKVPVRRGRVRRAADAAAVPRSRPVA